MSDNRLLRRMFRRAAGAVTAAAVIVPLLTVAPALADTTPPAGLTTSATTSTQSNVASNTVPLTGLVNNQGISITVTGSGAAAGKFFGAQARLCSGAANVTNQAGYNPTQTGNCIDTPYSASSDDFTDTSAAPLNNTVTFNFRVGKGIDTINTSLSGTQVIKCGAANPCRLWLKESVDTTLIASGIVWAHYDLQYAAEALPTAPTAVAGTGGNASATVNWTAPSSTGVSALDQYEVTATPTTGTPVVQTVAGNLTTANITGLVNGTTYTATVRARNVDGFGPASTASAPFTANPAAPPAPGKPSGTPGNNKVDLTWAAPASGPTPNGYHIVATPATGTAPAPLDTTGAGTSASFTGLTNGTVYTFTVAALYSPVPPGGTSPGTASAPSDPITPNGKLVTQTITVTRPQGALVLTQVCSTYDRVTPPAAGLPRVQSGPAPTLGSAPGGAPDPAYTAPVGGTGYPNPTDANGVSTANYPTNCSVSLGTAKRMNTGPGAGKFLQATGTIDQVTVVDERDSDQGWNLTGQMGAFTTAGDSFSGSQLGWAPIKTYTVGPDTNADGTPYALTVNAGPAVAPGTVPGTGGLATSQQLGTAPAPTSAAAGGIGTAVFDSDLTVWVPVRAKAGVYTGTLTITVA